jgi:hypothetical protein
MEILEEYRQVVKERDEVWNVWSDLNTKFELIKRLEFNPVALNISKLLLASERLGGTTDGVEFDEEWTHSADYIMEAVLDDDNNGILEFEYLVDEGVVRVYTSQQTGYDEWEIDYHFTFPFSMIEEALTSTQKSITI